jgi:nitroimidazol reductase NimA-like FMN-containing flavoprotein (pyridoxamine 5'-phosphate oxidase superfamily)
MKTHKREITAASPESTQRIYDFLKTHPIGVLATVDPNCDPHAAAVYFDVQQDFEITFVTKRDTRKHDNLRYKDHVMLIAYEPHTQTTVQVTAAAEELSEGEEAQAAFRHMLETAERTSEAGVPPISKLYAGYYVTYRLHPVQIRMAVFIRPDPGGYDMFETLSFSG